MTSLVMMYVYFDDAGDIKAIAPRPDSSYSNDFSYATFPLKEVEGFITAQKNSFNYMVKEVTKFSGVTYCIVKKASHVSYTRSVNNYLSLVAPASVKSSIITIVNDTRQQKISIQLAKDFEDMYNETPDEHQLILDKFLNGAMSDLHFTRQNNPYVLLQTVSFSPTELFSRHVLEFKASRILNNASVYTRKLIGNYGYIEKT
jgi:hypothetical protein